MLNFLIDNSLAIIAMLIGLFIAGAVAGSAPLVALAVIGVVIMLGAEIALDTRAY